MRSKSICLIVCAIFALMACKKEEPAKVEAPPPDVTVVVTQAQSIDIFQEFVGEVYGLKDIGIRARVEGFLEKIHFKEGTRIKAGDLLYTLESLPFQTDVAAQMSLVAAAKTMRAKATSDLGRIRPLAKRKAVSQSDLDAAIAQYDASKASVEAAEANLTASKIQLGYTEIFSPINGIIGKTQAKVGDFVGRSPNPVILNTISDLDTILVQFFLTETMYLKLMRRLQTDKDADADSEARDAHLELILADASVYRHRGKFDFLDRGVNPKTGAILVQASFPNPGNFLRPGQFAKIRAKVDVVKDGILIPQRSVTELQGRFSVFVVDDSNTVTTREVTTGPKIGQFWLIREGLIPGERVVYEGLQRVKKGVTVNPTVKEIDTAELGNRPMDPSSEPSEKKDQPAKKESK